MLQEGLHPEDAASERIGIELLRIMMRDFDFVVGREAVGLAASFSVRADRTPAILGKVRNPCHSLAEARDSLKFGFDQDASVRALQSPSPSFDTIEAPNLHCVFLEGIIGSPRLNG